MLPSRAKGNQIRNPAVNYFRRALAEAFYAKEKAGPATLAEVKFVTQALGNLFGRFPSGEQIRGDKANSCLAYQWISRLISFKNQTLGRFDSTNSRPLLLGGPVAAVLKMCNVPLDEGNRLEPRYMDEEYLRQAMFLDRKVYNGEPVYRFSHKDLDDARIVLPNPELTAISDVSNIAFNPPLDQLVSIRRLESKDKKKKKKAARPSSSRGGIELIHSPPASPIRRSPEGSPEDPDTYEEAPGTYEEYSASKASYNVRHSHTRTNMLQKPVKWVVGTVKRLVKKFKEDKVERERRSKEEKEAMQR